MGRKGRGMAMEQGPWVSFRPALTSAEELVEGDEGDLPAIEYQGQRLPGTVGLDAGILAFAVDDSWVGVDQDASAGDIDNPVDRDQGPSVQLQRRGQVVVEAGDCDLDQQADVSGPGVAFGGGATEQVAGADHGEVRQRGVAGVQDD